MIGKLIKRPIAVTMSIIAIMIVGVVSIGLLPVSLMPDVDIPQITVQITSPATSAKELDGSVMKVLKNQLMQTPHLKEIRTESNNGAGNIFMKFEHGSDIDFIFIDVNEKVDRALGNLPRELERPKVIKASATDIPVFFINMTTSDISESRFLELSRFASEVIVKRIEQIPEVALVDISGVSTPEIVIIPNSKKLESLGISSSTLKQAITDNNIKLGNLTIKDGYYQWSIRFNSDIKSKEDIEGIHLNINERIYLFKELASVTELSKSDKGIVRSNFNKAITLAVIKQSDSKMSSLRDGIDKLMKDFKKEYPEIEFEITRDQTQLLEYSISNLRNNVIIGAILACFVIFLFMQDFRSPLLVTVTIPLSLVVSLLFFYLVNISINIISLSGLILGIGMMVDNSIIVIDNITQHWKRGTPLSEAIPKATGEVFAPMLSSVLTTCSVFIPLIFLSGISGALFYDQAMGVTIGLFSSLIVAILVIPVYYYSLYKGQPLKRENRYLKRLHRIDYDSLYERGLKWTFRHQKLSWALFLLSIPCIFIIYEVIDKSKLPPLTHSDTIMKIDWNGSISLEENDKRTVNIIKSVEKLLEQNTAMIGSQQFMLGHTDDLSSSESMIYLKAKDTSMISDIEKMLSDEIHKLYPSASFSFVPSGNIFNIIFSDTEFNLVAKLRSKDGSAPDAEKLSRFLSQTRERLPDTYIAPVLWQEQYLYMVDQEMATLYNISINQIYSALSSATKENHIFSINVGTVSIPVVIGDEENDLSSLTVKNNKGADIPISLLIKESKVRDFKQITSGTEGDYYPLNINADDSDIPMIMKTIRSISKEGSDFDVSFDGAYFSNRNMIKELAVILIISILLLIFILAAQFESLIQPFIILSEIFVDIFGALLVLYLFGSGINLMSLIGLVVMSGIIINDSILKVDTINKLRKEGMPLLRAIFTAGNRRLKPIIMTSLTTILAIAPFLIRGDMGSDLQFPLSLALIGGMVVGTVVSIFFIPILYYRIYKNRG